MLVQHNRVIRVRSAVIVQQSFAKLIAKAHYQILYKFGNRAPHRNRHIEIVFRG